jgi:RimJ/RimL family protein N-acetyltransferase
LLAISSGSFQAALFAAFFVYNTVVLEAAAEFGRNVGAARLTLATALDNTAAQALYESSGWQRDRVFCHYTLPLEP